MKPIDVKCMTYLLWCRKQSLLNYLPSVPSCPTCLVLHAPWAACALVPCALRALLLCVSSVLHALMLHIPRTYMLFC